MEALHISAFVASLDKRNISGQQGKGLWSSQVWIIFCLPIIPFFNEENVKITHL